MLALLVVPVLICAIPLLAPARYRRAADWKSATLPAAGALLAVLPVGAFFLSGTLLLAVGAGRGSQGRRPNPR